MNHIVQYIRKYILLLILLILVLSACKKKDLPFACFTIPTTIAVGINTTFSAACSDLAEEYAWNFGDGTTSTEENPIHRFDSVGTYTITLDVKNESGSDSYSETVSVIIADEIRHIVSDITLDETWVGGTTHIVTRNIYVKGATLTIEPGAIIKLDANISINIGKNNIPNSKIIAEGTASQPIKFMALYDTVGAIEWSYIGFYEGNDVSSSLKYCEFEDGGGYSENKGSIHIDGTSTNINNCTIKESKYLGVSLDYDASFTTFANNTIENCADYPIVISCNYAHTIEDNNTFTTNTGILVMANTYVQSDETWLKQNCPYVLDGIMFINSTQGAKLTINAGIKISFTNASSIYIGYISGEYGTLITQGTSADPIIFTSDNSVKAAGDWGYLGFYDGSQNSSLTYSTFEYGGGGSSIPTGVVFVQNASISIDNCTINHSEFYGVALNENSFFGSFTNNTISNCGSYPLRVYGNSAHTIGAGNTITTNLGIEVKADYITTNNASWLNQNCPYIITGDLYVGDVNISTLTIEEGTNLEFKEGMALHIGLYGSEPGALIAEGTSLNPITFTVYDTTGGVSPRNWEGIYFYYGTDTNSVIDYCTVSYGGNVLATNGNINCIDAPNNFPVISNSTISNSLGYGIYRSGLGTPSESTNTFSGNVVGDRNY